MTISDTTSDLKAIIRLYDEYGRAFDQGRTDDYAALFTPDGSFTLPDGHEVVGTERLRHLAQGAAERPARPHHFVRNLTVEIDGDRAEGTAHAIAVAVEGSEVSLLVAGVYRDSLVRDNGRWRFASRKVTELSPDSLPDLWTSVRPPAGA